MLWQMQVTLIQELLADDRNPAVDVDARKINVKFINEKLLILL